MSFIIRLTEHAARNPVARAIERKRLQSLTTTTQIRILALRDGEDCLMVLDSIAEALAIAIKSIDGWDDPDLLGDILSDAIDECSAMASNAGRWDERQAQGLSDAFELAVKIIMGQDPKSKTAAWAWAQQIRLGANV